MKYPELKRSCKYVETTLWYNVVVVVVVKQRSKCSRNCRQFADEISRADLKEAVLTILLAV